MEFKSGNPALGEKVFEKEAAVTHVSSADPMTIEGAVNKVFFLSALLMLPASWIWQKYFSALEAGGLAAQGQFLTKIFFGGMIAGLILALITIFVKKAAPVTAPLYAIAQGFFLGGLSALMDTFYGGIVLQAVALTVGVLFSMLFLYRSRIIKVTQKFLMGVTAATMAVFLIYLLSFILRLFHINFPYIHDGGVIGIAFSGVVIIIAALNLVLDFHFISRGAEENAPKYMEWYAAFGLMVTLIWLYIEILHLLVKLRGRD